MDANPCILVVDDDVQILELLTRFLEGQGFPVRKAGSLAAMRDQVSMGGIDLIVLDVLLPDGNGMDACAKLRREGVDVPVILLTAMHEEVDRIVGLEKGADDYMGKPFSPRELVARIKAVLRRSEAPAREPPAPETWTFAGLIACAATRQVKASDGTEVPLTAGEFDVLLTFLQRPGRVVTRDAIIEAVHGPDAGAFDRAVDVAMSRIRKKLSAAGAGDAFKTVRNSGYQLVVPVQPGASA